MSNKLPPMPKLQEIIRTFGLSAKQQLSQNFLIDKNITDKICKTSGGFKDCTVIEVGAGPGGLTRSLLTSEAKKIIAVEMDPRFYPALKMLEDASEGRMKLIMANMLEVDEAKILFENGAEQTDWNDKSKVKIIGNLPFNVGTHLMLKWIRQISPREGLYQFGRVPMYLMFQKELADRINAKVGTEDYSRLSVMVQQIAQPRITYELPGKAFVPPPKVDAAVIEIEPRITPLGREPIKNYQYFEYVCRELFTHRRKMVSNVIKNLGSGADSLLDGIIDPKLRPQNLTVEQYVELSNRYCDFPNKNEIDIFEFLNEGKQLRKEKKLEDKALELKDKIEKTKRRQEFRLKRIKERKDQIQLLKENQFKQQQQQQQEEDKERDENDSILINNNNNSSSSSSNSGNNNNNNINPPKVKRQRLTQQEIDLEDLQIEEEIDKEIKQKDIRDLNNYNDQLDELLYRKEKNQISKLKKKDHLDIIDQFGNVVLHGTHSNQDIDIKQLKEDFNNIDEDDDYEKFLNEQLKK